MGRYDLEGLDEANRKFDEAVSLGQPTRNVYLARMEEQKAKLAAFDAADEAKDIQKRARHHEGKSTPFVLQSLGRGVETWARSYVGWAKPFLNEEEMIEFQKEDQRIAEGYNMAMDMGGLGATHKFLADGVKNGTDMAMKMVVARFTGGMPSLYTQYAAQGFTTAYYDARMSGLGKEESAQHAGWMTGIEIGTMAAFHAASKMFPKLLPDIESRVMAQLAGKMGAASGRRMASKGAAKIVNKSLLKSFGRGAGKMVWEGAVENVEEITTAVGHASRRAVDIPGAENEANWTDQNGNVMTSPIVKTILHTVRDTSGAILFVNGTPKIRHGIRRFLNSPSRKHARAVEAYLVAVGAAESAEALRDENVRIEAQQIVLKKLRDPESAPDVIAIAEEYGVQLGAGVATHWEGADGELPPILQGRGAYEVIPGVVLGARGAETEQAERAIVQLHNELGAKYGYKLRIVDVKADGDLTGIDGARITSNKTVWVTRQHIQTLLKQHKGSLKNVAAGIYAHELTHTLEESGGYQELMMFVHQNFRADYLKARNAYKTAHEKFRKEKGNEHVSALSDEQLNKEGLASWMESGFLKSGMLSKLAKSDMTLFERIRDWFYRRMNKWKDSRKYGEVFKMIQKISREYGLPVKPYPTKPFTDKEIAEGLEEDFDSQLQDRMDREDFKDDRKDPEQAEADAYQQEWDKSERDFDAGTTERRIFEGDDDANAQLAIEGELSNVTLEQDLGDAMSSRPKLLGRGDALTGKEPAIQVDIGGRLEDPKIVRERRKKEYNEDMAGAKSEKEKRALTRDFDKEMDQLSFAEDEAIRGAAEYEAGKGEYREAWNEAGERVREDQDQQAIVEESQAAHLEKFVAEETERQGYFLGSSMERAVDAHEVGTSTNEEITHDISPPQELPEPSTLRTSAEAADVRDSAWERVRDAERRGVDSDRERAEWLALRDRAESLHKQEEFDSFTSTAQDIGLRLQSEQAGVGVEVAGERREVFFDLPTIEDIYYGNVSEKQEVMLRRFLDAVNENNPGDYLLTADIRAVERMLDNGGRRAPVATHPSVASQMQAALGVPISVALPPTEEDTGRVAEDLLNADEETVQTPAVEPAVEPEQPLTGEEIAALQNEYGEMDLEELAAETGRLNAEWRDSGDFRGRKRVERDVASRVFNKRNQTTERMKSGEFERLEAVAQASADAHKAAETMPSVESRERGTRMDLLGPEVAAKLSRSQRETFADIIMSLQLAMKIASDESTGRVTDRAADLDSRLAKLGRGWSRRRPSDGKKTGKRHFYPGKKTMATLREAFPDVTFDEDFNIQFGEQSEARRGERTKKITDLVVNRHYSGVKLAASIAHEMHHISGEWGADFNPEDPDNPTAEETVEYLTHKGEIAAHAVEAAMLFEDILPGTDFDAARLAKAFPESKWKNYSKFADQTEAERIAGKTEGNFSAEHIRAAGESFAAQAQAALGRTAAEPAAAEPAAEPVPVDQQAEVESKKAADARVVVNTDVGQEAKDEQLQEESEMLQETVPEGSDTVLESTAEDEDIGQDPDFLKKVVAKVNAKRNAANARRKKIEELQEKIKALPESNTKEAEELRDELAEVVEESLVAETEGRRSFVAGTRRGTSRSGGEFADSENLYEMSVDEWEARRDEVKDMVGRIADSDKLYTEMPDELKTVVSFVEGHYGRLPQPVLDAQARKLSDFLYRPIKADPKSLAEATVVAMMTPTTQRDIHGNKVQDRNGKDKVRPIPSDLLDYVNNEQPRAKHVKSVLQMTFEDVEASPARFEDARVITSVPGSRLTPASRVQGDPEPERLSISPPSDTEIKMEAEERGIQYNAPPTEKPSRESVKKQAKKNNKEIERRLIEAGAYTADMDKDDFEALVAADPDFIDTKDDASVTAAQNSLHETNKQVVRNSNWNRIRLHEEEKSPLPLERPLEAKPFKAGDAVTFTLAGVDGAESIAVINSVIEGGSESLDDWRYDIEFVVKDGKEVPARKRHRRTVSAYVPTVVTRKFTPARSEQLKNIFEDVINSQRAGSGKYNWILDPELVEEAFETIEEAGLSLEEKITNDIVRPELMKLGWEKQTKGGRSKLTDLKAAARKDGLSEGEINSLIGKIVEHEIEEKSGLAYKRLVNLIAELDYKAISAEHSPAGRETSLREILEGTEDQGLTAGLADVEAEEVMGANELSAAERIDQRVEQTEGVAEKREEIEREIAKLGEQLEETQGSDEGEELVVMRGSEEERDILERVALLQRQLDDNVQLALRGAGNEQTSLLVEIARMAREVSGQFGFKNPTPQWMRTLVDYEELRDDVDEVMGDLARIYGDTGEASWEQESTELADRVYEDDKSAFDEIEGYIQIIEESGSVSAQAAAKRLNDSMFANIFDTTPEQVIEDHDKAAEQVAAEDEDAYDPLEDEGRVSLDSIAGGLLGEQLSLQSDDIKNEITALKNKVKTLSRQIKEADHSEYSESTRRVLAKKMRSTLTLIGMLNREAAEKLNKIYKIRREVSDRVQFETFGKRPPARSTKVDDFQLSIRREEPRSNLNAKIKSLSNRLERANNLRFSAPNISGFDKQIEAMEGELKKLVDIRDSGEQSQLSLNLDRGKWEGMTKEEEEFYEGLVSEHYSSDDPKHWGQLEAEADLKWQRHVAELGPERAREFVIKQLEGITDAGGTPDHVLSILGNQLTEGIYAEAFGDTGNADLQTTAAKMTRALLSYGTEVARKLYFLRRLSPIQKIRKALGEAFFMPPERVMAKVRKLKKQERHGDAKKVLDDWTDNKLPKLHKYLREQGWKVENFDEIASDPMKASQLLDVISQFTARWDDKLFEYWRNSILSGPTTQIANLMGTVFFGAYELGLKRNMQAAANIFIGSDNLPTFEENLEVLKQMYVSATTSAVDNFRKSWQTEQMVLEAQLREAGLGIGVDIEGKFGSGGKQFIKGKTGKVVRIPQRGLLAVDDYMKTVLTESYAMGYAFRASRKQVREGRLTMEDSPKFIRHLMTADKKAERIWMPAYQQALRQAWQTDLPAIGQMAVRLRNEYPITRFVIPFIVTPMNIMATGVAMTPFSGFMSLYRLATLRDQGVSGADARVEQVEKIADGFTNTVLSGMWMMVLMALTDDDDPWITGSEVDVTRGRQRYGSGRIGEVPSQSVRFPFSDKWYSYARVEPFATATALTIDLIKTMKHAGAGNTEKAIQDIGRGLYGQVTEKTFIRGIGEVVQAMEETFKGRVAQGGGEYLSNFAVSFVPNIVRSTARATQESMPERRMTTEKGKQLMSLLEITAKKTEILPALGILEDHPKTDFYGRKIPRHQTFGAGGLGDFMYRVFIPVPVKSTHSFVGDEVMKRYNNRLDDPMDAYIGPERPSRFFTVGGKKKYMSNAQYDEYNQMRGDLAKQYTRFLNLNVDNPTEADIDKLKEGHRRASATAREYCVEKFWGDPTMIPLLEAKTANELRADSIRAHSKILSYRRPTLKTLSKEEKRLPYEMRLAILEDRVMEHEIVRESAAKFLISEGVSMGEAASSYGRGVRGRKNIKKAMRTYGG